MTTEGTIEMRPTMNFRWLRRVPEGAVLFGGIEDQMWRKLQQQFVNTATGQTEWRDVPVVEQQ